MSGLTADAFSQYGELNCRSPDKSLNINNFVGPLGTSVISNDEFGLKKIGVKKKLDEILLIETKK
jgi:hypothetical protein